MLKLMLLEDQADDREAIERIVRSLDGVEWLGSCACVEEALRAAASRTPDVAIAAVELADLNGLLFAGRLRRMHPSVRIIVSARSGRYAAEAYEAGADGYLVKPVDRDSLIRALNRVRAWKQYEY